MKPAAKPVGRKVPVFHAHGCTQCRQRYTDVCSNPFANGRCHSCQFGHEPTTWDRGHWPKACCRTSSRLITDNDTLNRFKLAGDTGWWRCLRCHRTTPYDPAGVI